MRTIIEDSRQKKGKHTVKNEYWATHNIRVVRSSLPWGDYIAAPRIAIDTKQDVHEIAANLCGSAAEKKRVREEVKKARDAGCKLIFLIEDPHYNEIEDLYGTKVYLHSGRTIPGDQLATAMHVMEGRYGCEFWFCDPSEAGRVIEEILNA